MILNREYNEYTKAVTTVCLKCKNPRCASCPVWEQNKNLPGYRSGITAKITILEQESKRIGEEICTIGKRFAELKDELDCITAEAKRLKELMKEE